MKAELHPSLSLLEDGISEYTFAGLYLFRKTYNYHVAYLPIGSDGEQRLILRGQRDGKKFYAFPHGLPPETELRLQLMSEVDYIKGLAERFAEPARAWAENNGRIVYEDRDNFDYLYLRSELATLEGKKFHQKRNHVNAFMNNYEYTEKEFCAEGLKDAYYVLDAWRSERDDDGDYHSCKEALDRCADLELCGYIVYADGKPAAFTMGEPLQKGKTFAVHMEKAAGSYRGIYQFINMAFAGILPEHYQFINREQDLGNPGLRQAKMTYRPSGFIKKYRLYPVGAELPAQLVPTEQFVVTI